MHPEKLPNSFSQAGEDRIVNFLFEDYGKNKISYLDLGANYPDHSNNTFLFYRNGGRGVCVEADATLIDGFKAMRPEDKVINAGVSAADQSEATFYIFDVPFISTFNKKEVTRREALGNHKVIKKVQVPLVNINSLIETYFDTYPDFLSIDVETLDYEVLQALDCKKYPISVICVETCKDTEHHIRPKDQRFRELMELKGYEVYADTYINTIFVNKEWFYNSKPVPERSTTTTQHC
ncbi:MAG: FkbM family methyltransferase [Candidatus Electrothrix sp. AU1_5]|nr:FkbM family methyltransferase [Candidatus Electrothrix gigas]